MLVRVTGLGRVVAAGRHDKSVVGVDEFGLVHRVVARSRAPSGMAAGVPTVTIAVIVVGARRGGEVQQMGDGRLPPATRSIADRSL